MLLILVTLTASRTVDVRAQATNPPYLSQFPSVDRVKAEIKGSDSVDTSVRQLVALIRLRIIIEDLARARLDNKLTPDESRVSRQYSDARRWYNEHPPSAADRDRWFTLEGRYLQDDGFRDELLRRFFLPEFRTAYYRVTRKQPPQPTSEKPNAPAVSEGDLYFAKGVALQEAKKYAPAIEAYQKSIALEPNSKNAALAHKAIGMIHNDQGRYREAVTSLRESLRLRVGSPYIVSKELGFAYYMLERYEEALSPFQQAIAAKPDYTEAHYLLGWTYVHMGKRNEALEAYRSIQRIDKTYDAHKLYEAINQMSAAAPKPNVPSSGAANADAYKAQGDNYREAKDYAKAIEAYKKAIALNPSHADAYNGLALCYDSTEQRQLAISAWNRTLALKPNAEAFILLGNAHQWLKQYDEALKAYRSAIGLKPEPETLATAHFMIGTAYVGLDQFEKALDPFQQAARLDPNDAQNHCWVGNIYIELKQYEKALRPLQEALRLRPDYAIAASKLGDAYFLLGQYTTAVVAFKRAIRLKPDHVDAHYFLGSAYVKLGNKEEALQIYRTLQTLDRNAAQELLDEIKKMK